MTKGSPKFTARMPAPVIQALKQMAQEQNRKPSDILREFTINGLMRAGYDIKTKEGKDTIA